MIKITFTTLLLFFIGANFAQNIGVNQNNPTNSLHISPVNVGDNPVRIDGLQPYALGDTSLLVVDQATGVLKYINASDFVTLISASGNLGSDNQTIDSVILSGTNLTVYIENGTSSVVNLASLQDGVNDADSDPTNEIELPATANTGQVLTWNGSSWIAQNAPAGSDNWG